MKLDGTKVDPDYGYSMYCKGVTGTLDEIDAANPGWMEADFDVQKFWDSAVVGITSSCILQKFTGENGFTYDWCAWSC